MFPVSPDCCKFRCHLVIQRWKRTGLVIVMPPVMNSFPGMKNFTEPVLIQVLKRANNLVDAEKWDRVSGSVKLIHCQKKLQRTEKWWQVAPAQSEPDFYTGLRGRPVVEAIVYELPIWAQIFLMPDRCKQEPKTRYSTCKTEVVHRCRKWHRKWRACGRVHGQKLRLPLRGEYWWSVRRKNASSWGCPHVAYEDITNIGVY